MTDRDIISLNLYKAISDEKLSNEAKEFIADLMESIIVKRLDKSIVMIAKLNNDDNNQLDAMANKLHKLLDLIGGY